jgi:hypothetical protein
LASIAVWTVYLADSFSLAESEGVAMGRYYYVVLTRAVAGREAEFDAWYDGQHLGDVARIEGVARARRYPLLWQKVAELDAPEWRSLTVYEIEADDPKAVIASILKVAGTDAMPLSDAMARSGMIQALAGPIGEPD